MRPRRSSPKNVTRQPPVRGLSFILAFTAYRILPDDGNYRYCLNAGIIAMNMEGIAPGEDPQSAAGPCARGIRR
jgi:hypothetical protein